MKNRVLIALLLASMLTFGVNGTSTAVLAAPEIDFEALDRMSSDLNKQIEALDNLDLSNPPPMAEPVSADNTIIQTDMMIAASNTYTLGLQKNGRVVASGFSLNGADAVSNWRGIKMIAAGFNHSVGLKSDGTVITAGSNNLGQRNVSEWKDIIAIAAGGTSTIGLKRDGTVIGAGFNDNNQLDFSSWNNIVAIASGTSHTVGLKSDGTVLAVGKKCGTILNTSDWRNIVSISASSSDIMGLDKNGKVYSTYANNVSGFKDCVGIATAEMYAAGLKKDGTVITTADDVDVSSWRNIISIAAGTSHIVGLRSDGTVVSVEMEGAWNTGQTKLDSWNLSVSTAPTVAPAPPKSVAVVSSNESDALPTASKVLVNGSEKAFDAYTISGSNYFKLRDLAFVVNGTEKQVDITWDGSKNAINLLSKKAYTVAGGELSKGNGQAKRATVSTAKIYVDGQEASLTAYSINGSNYFKLRDVMKVLDVSVGWDGTKNTITLDTSKAYQQ